MDNNVTLEDIVGWTVYFHSYGVNLDFNKIKQFYKEIQKSNRELRRSFMSDKEKEYIKNLNKYRKSVLENVIVNSEPFKNGNFLEGVGFINNYKGDYLRVHPNYDISHTYRISSNNPCLSNMDNYLKDIVVADEGYKLLSIDFKHQEPWIIVNLLEDEVLLDILTSNNDFYIGLMNRFDVEITDRNRGIMKDVWNSSIYGAGRYKIGFHGVSWIDEVYNFINDNERVISLREKVKNNLKNDKSIYTRFLLNRNVTYDGKQSVRKAFNSIFQMSGSGVMYTGLKSIQSTVNSIPSHSKLSKIKIYLTLHDEFLLQIPDNMNDEDIDYFMSLVDFDIEGWTPSRVKVKCGKSWRECE